MPKQTALDTINRLIVEDRENGVTRRRTGGTLSTIDRLIQEEDERQRQREEEERQRRQARLNALSADSAMDLVRSFGDVSAERKAAETPRRSRQVIGSALTPELEAEYQRRNGGGNSLSPYQAYMQAQMAQLPKATAPEETRSTDELRRDMNRKNRIAGGTERMAADMSQGLQNRLYDPTYTTNLQSIQRQAEASRTSADRATDLYQTLSTQRRLEEEQARVAELMKNPDFREKSQGKPEIANSGTVSSTGSNSAARLYRDIYYRGMTGADGKSSTDSAARNVTDEEAAVFFYIWNTQGARAAESYYKDYVENRASQRQMETIQRQAQAYGEYDPIGASIRSVGTNLMSGVGLIDMAWQNLARTVGLTDKNKPLNYYSAAQSFGLMTDALRQGASDFFEQLAVDELKRSAPGLKNPEKYAWVASFLYQTGMSMADSGVSALLTSIGIPEPLTLANMGAAAGTRAIRDAKERGATDGQALAFGVSSAIMEALFEKISMDKILEPSYADTFKAHLWNAVSQSFTEGSEEVMTTLANTAMDQLIMGDKSELFARQRELMEQGVGEKEALGAAFKQWGTEVLGDFLGGLVSGFGMGGVKEAGYAAGALRNSADNALLSVDLQNMANAAQAETQLRQQYEQQQNAPQPQPLTIPSQEVVSSRQTDPLGYAMDKARQGETVNKSDARAIIENPQALQALRDTGALTGNVSNDSEGRQKIIDAVASLAEQRTQESSMPAAETQQTAATETERADNPYDDLLSQIWGEQAQERTAPTTATETRTETNDPAWDRIVADLEAQRARAAEQRAQERTQREEEVSTPPVPGAQETASEALAEGKLRLPEQKDTPPVPRSGLTLRSQNATLNENRQEVTNGQAETAAPAETADERRARNETAVFRRAANDAAGGADLDRAEWRAGLGRLLQAVRNSRDAGARQQRRSEAARITDQAEAGNPERLSARDLGVEDGTDEKTAVRVDDKILGSQWQQTVADYARRGIKLTAISGQMQLDKRRLDGSHVQARAYISADGKNIVVQADNPRLSWHQLLAHEELHRLIKEDSGYRKRVMDALLADKKVRPYLSQIIDRYAEAYHGVDPTATDEDIIEELLADYRAGFDMLDPLGTNRTLAKVTKAAAKDIRAVEKKGYTTNGGKPAPAGITETFAEGKNSVEPPYRRGTKALEDFENSLSPKARDTYDLFKRLNEISLGGTAIITVGSGKKAHLKRDTIADKSFFAQDWNNYVKTNEEFAATARELVAALPKSVKDFGHFNDDGTITPTEFEEKFKMNRSFIQRVVDALPKNVVQPIMTIDGHEYRISDKAISGAVGGEEYRQAILAEKRRLYKEGKLPLVSTGSLSHDNWGAMGFLATNTKTGASGDFTTFCPQMYFNNGCFYCYRRAALTSGSNNKLTGETVWYSGEILQLRPEDVKSLNKKGGLRIQSFGDWQDMYTPMLADMLYDAQLKGLQIKIITKEPSMIETVARLREQALGLSLYFNLSADYTIERRGESDNRETRNAAPLNAERPFIEHDWLTGEAGEDIGWKRALTVQEANEYRKKYSWVNTRIVATTLKEYIRGLIDPTVDVVTGYHGKIKYQERVSSETGETLIEVEALGDSGMPQFTKDEQTGEWTISRDEDGKLLNGKNRYQKALCDAIVERGLQEAYYQKACCITGHCQSCQGQCGAYANKMSTKNARNRDPDILRWSYAQMEMHPGAGMENSQLFAENLEDTEGLTQSEDLVDIYDREHGMEPLREKPIAQQLEEREKWLKKKEREAAKKAEKEQGKASTEIAMQDVQEMEENPDTFIDSAIGERVKYSYDIQAEQDFEPLRDEDGNIKYVYKAFYVMKDEDGIGRLYPPMISNVSDEEKKKVKGAVSGTQRNIYTPVGIVLTADVGMLARYKKDTVDEDGTLHKAGELVRNTLGRLAVTNDKGSGTLAFRPGWHLGEWPDAKQFNKDSKIYGKRAAMPDQLVFAKCEIAGSVDYQLEAMRHGVKKNGKYDRTQAGLPRVPVNGYYKYRTNPDPDTAPWYITGQMRVVEILTDEQCREICAQYGVEMSPRESGHDIDLEEYGLKAGPVDRETNTDRFLKSEKSKANERELETALSDPEYSEAYAPRDIDFDDPEILKEFERNRQDSEYYRGQYQQKYGGSASIEIDPEVAAQFSPEALALREETKGRRRNPFRERKVSRVRSNTYENSGLFDEVEAQMDEADESNYEYDPISEKRSMNEARKRLKDFDGEVAKLSQPDYDWGGSDLDTAMGILHRYRTEGRATGDYGDFWRWSKVIQEKGTKGGQFIQAFAKYTRTGTGAAMKGAKDIHDRFKLNPAQQKQVDAAKKKLMDGIGGDMNGAAQDAMKQAKGQKEPGKKQDGKVDKKKLDAEIQRRKDAERLVREISKLFEKQQNHGEPVENWLNLTGEELARKIAGRFSEPKQRTKTTMQTILSDLVGFAEEHALPDRKKAEGTKRTAIDTITDYLNNRDAYGTAWAAAQSYLRAAYTDDQEKLDALNSFLTATIAYNSEGTDRTMLDAILQSADVLGISEKRILELTSAGATASTIDRIGDELVNQVKERMGADYDESFTQQLKDAVRRHITGIALQESAEEQRLRLGGMTTDAARQLEINLQKLLTQSRGDKNRAAQSVADYLIRELGIPSSDAAIAAERITGAFMDELASRADRKLQQMFAEKKPKTQEQRDKLLDLIRLGGLTNSNVEDAVVDALGIGGMSRERQRELVGAMAQFGETLDAMEADDLDGLKDLIRAQAAVRNTPLSRQAEKILAGETDAQYLREFALAQLDAIAGDFAEMSPGAKISTFQTISHLLNMRTALRNLTSNQVFDLVDSAANNLATIPDMVIGAFTGKRTVGVNKSWLSEMKRAGAKQGAARNALEVRLDVSPDDRQKSKYGTAGRRTNSMAASNAFGRILSHLEEVMGYELNTTDEFHKGSVRGETLESLARFVERGDITQEQANAWAEEEALYRSFQDDTLVGNIMGELKTLLNVIGFGDSGKTNSRGRTIHDFGLGDLVVKYTQVPGALIHRGVEYSPLGYAKMLYDLAIAKDSLVRTQKRGEDVANAQRKLALDIGRATTGSGLITLFAVLAKAGLLRRDDDDKDKNAKAMHAAQGLSGTQLNFTALKRWIEGGDLSLTDGDVLADIGFLEPLDSLMTIATLMANDEDLKLTDIGVKSLDGVWKAISNTSAMQTVSNIISTVQYHDEENDLPLYFQIPIEIASDSLSGFVPSPVRQLAQATDTTYRDQYRSKDLNKQIQARVMNSIPGVRQLLAPKITPLGEDRKYQKPLLNYLNATLNPGNINVYQGSGVVDELNRVYDETDDAKIWPERNAPYSFTANDEKYTLTPDERTQYQRTRGQTTANAMGAVMGTDWYKSMGATGQAEVLNWIGNFSNFVAKKEMLEARGQEYGSTTYNKYYEAWQSGTPIEDVVADKYGKLIKVAEETAAAETIIAEAKIPEASKEEAETMSADAKRLYAAFLQGGVSDATARDLATSMEGSEASGHEQWRMVYDAAGKEGEKAVTSVMTDDMKRNWELAKDAGVSMDDYIKVREGFKDLNGNGNKSQDEWNATLDSFTFSTNDAKDKSIKGTLWQILTGSGSTKNNPYDKDAGQKVLDAKSKGGGKGSGSYAPARIPTLKLPTVESAPKRNTGSGLKIRGTQTTSAAPRSGLRLRAK